MYVENFDSLKLWMSGILKNICDANPSALAQYIIALLKKDRSDQDLKALCIEQLDVFLLDATHGFVDKLFVALNDKSYLLPLEKSHSAHSNGQSFNHPHKKFKTETRSQRLSPENEANNYIEKQQDKDICTVKFINDYKGNGVFATKDICNGEFILEYAGPHIDSQDGEKRFLQYSATKAAYLYFYSFKGKKYCIDGNCGRAGRFMNDDHINPNAKMKLIADKHGKPHICAFARKDIKKDEEIVYDYGDRDCPWRHNTKVKESLSEDSGSEYYPLSEDSRFSSHHVFTTDEEDDPNELKDKVIKEYKREKYFPDEAQKNQIEPTHISVKTCLSSNGKRKYDKKHYCFYCEKGYTKIARHYEQMHLKETEVAKIFSYKSGSKERLGLLQRLRNQGDFQHNSKIYRTGDGQIVTKRQPCGKSSANNYLPCANCLALFVKKDLWRHKRKCPQKEENKCPGKKRVQAEAALILPFGLFLEKSMTNVMRKMVHDDISTIVRNDPLIVKLGERLYLQKGEVTHQHADIRNKMRELAKLLLEVRKNDHTITSVNDFVNPKKFNAVIKAVKSMTGFSKEKNQYAVPSTAIKLRHTLLKITSIMEGDALRNKDEVLNTQAKQFKQLIQYNWEMHISTTALKTLYQQKWNKPQMLSLTEDLHKLHNFLKFLEQDSKKELIKNPNVESWYKLGQVTLTQIILFNRRREDEASRLLVKSYKEKDESPMQDDILRNLTELEKICDKLIRIEIRGKGGRKVPILLTKNMKHSIDALITNRQYVGINELNTYVFARPYFSSMESISGSDCLRQFTHSCGAKNPEYITSTRLRKHVATVSQLIDLKSAEIEQLASFLGHDLKVHQEFYRLPEDTLQLAKVCQILLAAEKGMHLFKGKKLDEVDPDAGKYIRQPWSHTEKEAVETLLYAFIKKMKVPGKSDCEKCITACPVLTDFGRDWRAVKNYIHNRIVANKRRQHMLFCLEEPQERT
ncbi:uncharacterized protein LOC144772856 isoform X2 [Lissotriton helveticus]